MKKFFGFLAGFFQADSTNSSKRLVGIAGAGTLYYTLYSNSHTASAIVPSDALVWGTVTLSGLALGLATAKEFSDLLKAIKGGGNSEPAKTEE